MNYFIYDGSFEGLLTAIYDAFYSKYPNIEILRSEDYITNLFSQKEIIQTDQNKFEKVYKAIKEKISTYSLQSVYYAYLSELVGIETSIYHYLKLGFKLGAKVDKLLSNDLVRKIENSRHKVSHETHIMKGILRFRCLENNIYYAPIEPGHNIIGLISPHFSKRLADQNWIIHDLKREVASIYNQHEWVITPLKEEDLKVSDSEKEYQELWNEFFNSTAIKSKINPKLQRQFLPKRYWKHLIEKE